jgi:hypothetical protein
MAARRDAPSAAPVRAVGGVSDLTRLRAPVLQLISPAGRQDGVRGSSCVSSVDAEGQGVALCVDTLRPYPERLTVAEPSTQLILELADGDFTEPAAVTVTLLGCTDPIAGFTLDQSGDSWAADLAPGTYELDVFFLFATPGGLSGDSYQSLGLIVASGLEPAILPATAGRFVCAREFRPQLVTGGTRAERAVVSSVLDRLTASYAPAVRITKPPKGWPPATGMWLRVRVTPGSPADAVLPTWQGLLAVGAFRDLARGRGFPPLAGYSLRVDPPSAHHERGTADGAVPRSAPTATEIRSTVEAAAAEAGVRLDSLLILRPLGPAPVVIVTASDPARFLAQDAAAFLRALRTLTEGDGPAADGLFVEMRDPAGQPFEIRAVGTRAGASAQWTREDLAAVDVRDAPGA